MTQNLKNTLEETKRKIRETRESLEDIARIGDQSLRVNKSELLKSISNQTFTNLKIIPGYLLRLSKSQGYKEVSEQLVKDFKSLAKDYLFLKKQYSL